MADQYQLTASSTAADKAEAVKQLNQARTEWNEWLRSNTPGPGYAQKAEPKLQEILQKYPYVESQTTGRLVSDQLYVKTDGTINFPNAKQPLSDVGSAPNRDDAYSAISGSSASPKPNTGTQHPNDPGKIQTGASARNTTDGSAATDAPGVQGQQQRPNQGDTAAPSNGTAPPSGTSDATPSPGNSTGPSTSKTEQGSQTTTTDPNREGGGSSNTATPIDDDKGTTADPNREGTGINTGGSNNVTTNGGGATALTSANETPLNRKIKVRSNILHEYVNWSYQIGLYMLDSATYNEFILSGKDSSSLRSRPILKSGGFKKTGSGMKNDLYVSNLRFTSVVGNNKASPNANLFSVEMSVVEPYGVNFLPELKRMADEMGGDQQQFQLPYLLEIKFAGYDDKGKIVTNIKDSGPKLVPCQIINITFNITGAGTTYNITLVPYSQIALNTQFGVARQRLQLYGQNLREILVEGPNSLAQALNDQEDDAKDKKLCEFPDRYKFVVVSFGPNNSRNEELLNSKVTFRSTDSDSTVIYRRGTSRPTAGGPTDAPVNDPLRQYFEVAGGSNIKDVVQRIAMQTKYFQDRMTTNAPNSQRDRPMELIKVIPVVEIGEFDKIRQRYQRTVTYKVTTYFKYGEIYPYAGQATVDQGLIAKEYNWLFTGKNQDIINVDLQYNLAYFNLFQNASPSASAAMSGTNTVEDTVAPENPGTNETAYAYMGQPGQASYTILRGAKDTAVQEYFDQQLNNPNNADLVQLDIDIIGDPDWIPQDLSIRPLGDLVEISSNGFDRNGSIAVDAEAVYAKVKFKTPRDYSDTTGLMELTTDQTMITGVYQVITVDSVFESGTFKQTLHMVRAKNQTENKPSNAVNRDNQNSGGRNTRDRQAAGGRTGANTNQSVNPSTFNNSNNVTVQPPAPASAPTTNAPSSGIEDDAGRAYGPLGLTG